MPQTILITGCSSGIGRATARLFADKGWNVIATMRDPEKGKDLAGETVMVTRLDVQDQDSIARAVDGGLTRFGAIDVLVNNAGYAQYGLFEAIPREKIIEQFDVNLFGVMDVTRAVLPYMRKAKHGAIVNISSGAGLFTLPMTSLYHASKFALEGFSESLAYELASQNIVVKLIEPHGGVNETAFGARTAASAVADASLSDYDVFAEHTAAAFARMVAATSITSADVAEIIFSAATDGTDRLRYLVGNDTRGFVKAWNEEANAARVAFQRDYFR